MKKSNFLQHFFINKSVFLSLRLPSYPLTFVSSETERSLKGHPDYRFLKFFKRPMLKNCLHIILFSLLLAQANGQVTFRAIGGNVTAGNTIDISIQVKNFTNVAAFAYTMVYDTNSLDLITPPVDVTIPGSVPDVNEPSKGIIKTNWFENNNISLADGTIIYKLRFLAKATSTSKIHFIKDNSFVVADSLVNEKPYLAFYGSVNTTYLHGDIIYDFNEDCTTNDGELGLNDIPVRIEKNGWYQYTTSDHTGSYEFSIQNTNTPTIKILPRTTAWKAACSPATFPVDVIPFSENVIPTTLLQAAYACPHMEVDVSTAYVAPCQNFKYWVNYRNNGPAPAFGASVKITLDTFMTYNGSNLTPTQLNGRHLEFNIGNVNTDQSGRFYINVKNSCVGTVEGQAQSVSAEIFPNTICDPVSPAWDQSSLKVTGTCAGDSVRFVVQNVGTADMTTTQDFIIIEDMILGKEGHVKLDVSESKTLTELTDGHTYRLIANQSPHHPGRSYPTVALEGCDGYTSSTMLGSVTEFAEDDANPSNSIDVQESTNTPIPNTIIGHPKGYGPEFEITSHTDLTYLIRFKNTTEATLTELVIQDTLSPFLDMVSVEPGASSVLYDFTLTDKNIVQFTLLDTLLPGTEGFVKFRVRQTPNNDVGTKIATRANIGLPTAVATDSVFHTVGGDTEQLYVMVDVHNPINPNIKLDVYPNPFTTETTIEIKDYPKTDLRLRLYGINGSVLLEQSTHTGKFRLSRSSISKGVYVFVIENGNIPIASGKIVAP